MKYSDNKYQNFTFPFNARSKSTFTSTFYCEIILKTHSYGTIG